jgi:hypothetical protein
VTYQLSTTSTGVFESFDLDSLPLLTWTNPTTKEQQTMPARQLLQEGKIGVHELFRLLESKGIPGIKPTDGGQALLVCWARELKKRADEANILIGDAGAARDKQEKGRPVHTDELK